MEEGETGQRTGCIPPNATAVASVIVVVVVVGVVVAAVVKTFCIAFVDDFHFRFINSQRLQ